MSDFSSSIGSGERKIKMGECHFYQFKQDGEVPPKLYAAAERVEFEVKGGPVDSKADVVGPTIVKSGESVSLSLPDIDESENEYRIFTLYIRGVDVLNMYSISAEGAEFLTVDMKMSAVYGLPTEDPDGKCVNMEWNF